MSTTAIILAAGKSTRMKSKRPKPLHEICGRPMLRYVLDACYEAGCDRVLVVIGHGKEEILAEFGRDKAASLPLGSLADRSSFGTGHAVAQKMCELRISRISTATCSCRVAGDGPLIRGQVLKTLHSAHRQDDAAASMATAMLDDPTGYGRVVRAADGAFLEIVEQVDCTPEQREIREVFPSYYCLKAAEPAILRALEATSRTRTRRRYTTSPIFTASFATPAKRSSRCRPLLKKTCSR